MSIDLKHRTKSFALNVVCLCADLPRVPETRHIIDQLQRCATKFSVLVVKFQIFQMPNEATIGKIGNRKLLLLHHRGNDRDEFGTSTRLAGGGEVASHHATKFAADRKTQPGAAIFPGGGRVRLLKGLK